MMLGGIVPVTDGTVALVLKKLLTKAV